MKADGAYNTSYPPGSGSLNILAGVKMDAMELKNRFDDPTTSVLMDFRDACLMLHNLIERQLIIEEVRLRNSSSEFEKLVQYGHAIENHLHHIAEHGHEERLTDEDVREMEQMIKEATNGRTNSSMEDI